MPIKFQAGVYRFQPEAQRPRLRVLALVSDDPQQHYLLQQLAQHFELVGALIEPGAKQHQRLWNRGKYLDWWARAWQSLRQRHTGRAAYRQNFFATPAKTQASAINQLKTEWIGSKAALSFIQELKPDVTVVCGTSVIPRRIIQASGLMINIHGGYLPDYRGNHCVFFAYYRSDFEKIAATLHIVTEQLDAGGILQVVHPAIYPHDHDEHLYCRALWCGMQQLFSLLRQFESGEIDLIPQAQTQDGEMFRHRSRLPWLDLMLAIKRRFGLHPVPHRAAHIDTKPKG